MVSALNSISLDSSAGELSELKSTRLRQSGRFLPWIEALKAGLHATIHRPDLALIKKMTEQTKIGTI